MKITKIKGSDSTLPKSFTDGLKEFENALLKRLQTCEKCSFEFLCYYNANIPPASRDGYKNAIWIKVHNLNKLNIWIRVHNDTNGKKINVFTDSATIRCNNHPNECLNFTWIKRYAFPLNFSPKGCYMSHKGRFVNKNLDWNDILDEIYLLLPCLCNAM